MVAPYIVSYTHLDVYKRQRQALVNENQDMVAQNPKYVMRITGDNAEGKAQLDYFIAEDSPCPVIVTTSKLMTTGVDCKTCRLIVPVSYTHLDVYKRQEQEGVCPHRGLAKPSFAGRKVPVCLRGWHLSAPELGRRVRKRGHTGGRCV